jgi:hypothetical protein
MQKDRVLSILVSIENPSYLALSILKLFKNDSQSFTAAMTHRVMTQIPTLGGEK